MYVAGGRSYFEADIVGSNSNSFTAKGFFDKLGYVEPPPSNTKKIELIVGLTVGLGGLLIGGVVFYYCYWRKRKAKDIHID